VNNQERSEDEVVCGETIDHEIEIVYEDETLDSGAA
jgi:hypothetical protein